jgi:CheY-like chemotaxis protein
MKPRWGSGSIGLESISDMEDLDIYYNILMKKIKKTILATASVGNEYILIQEKLTGNEYGLDVMNDLDGNNVGVSVKQKLAMRSGETDKAITLDLPDVKKMGEQIGNELRHIGNLDVDIMQRANGDYCVLELNPRFGGGFPFSYEAGVNLPKAIIEWIKGNDTDYSILIPQYNRMFAKNDYDVTVSQEIYDAISKFKRGNFDIVIIDLFIPTEREGFLLLEELKKMSDLKKQNVKIGVITASAKKEHKIACRQKGVAFYMEKSNNWQKELIDLCKTL